jgi:hypothetical protein
VINSRKPSAAPPRHRRLTAPQSNPSPSGVPQLVTTQPGEENGFIARLREAEASAKAHRDESQPLDLAAPVASAIPAYVSSPSEPTSTPSKSGRRFPALAPRRFHLSKATSATLSSQSRKRKADVAVFVSEEAEVDASTSVGMQADRPEKVQKMLSEHSDVTRPRKRPGATSSTPSSGTPRKTEIKEADPVMQDALQAYAMEEFGITYGQRITAQPQPSPDVTMTEEKDDQEYTYDTYMRQDAADVNMSDNEVDATAHPSEKARIPGAEPYGILVIPEEQHELFLETFGEDATSEDEGDWDSEQDDENAENYYAADYPEDEVESDDERGYGAYEKYRTAGGDLSEEDEEVSSEEERTAASRYPWLKQMRRDVAQDDADESDEEEA